MKNRFLLILVAMIGLLVFWNNYYPSFSMKGTYVSNNTRPILEGPRSIDTLKIFRDGTFENEPWGKGKYSIEGNEISFYITYDFGDFLFHTDLSRRYFIGSPKINLDSDLGFYFEKVK